MKILLCHNYYATRAGEAQVVAHEAELLEKHGHQVIRLERDNADIARMSPAEKLRTFFTSFHNPGVVSEAREIVSLYRPDIAHVHNVFPRISPSLYRTLYSLGVPVVQTFHNFRFLCISGLLFKDGDYCGGRGNGVKCVTGRCYRDSYIYSAWYAALLAWHRRRGTFLSCIDRYIALNGVTRDIFVKAGFPYDKFVVKPNSASVEDVPHIAEPDDYAVFVGRLSREKDIMTLLEASARVPDLPLIIVGDGPCEDDARDFVRDRGLCHVTFRGKLPPEDCAGIIAGALVTVFPSTCHENCPLTVINSVYLGTPVIGSRTGGMPDFVPEGKAGWLVTPGDVDAWTARLAFVAARPDEAVALRPSTRLFGLGAFGSETNYNRLVDVYRAAMRAAASRHGDSFPSLSRES